MTAALLTVTLLSFQLAGETKSSPTTDEILSLILQHSFEDGGFTVVDPDTEVRHLERIAKDMGVIEVMLDLKYYGLVEKFFEKNKKSSRLSLKSDLSKGYVIDYDGKFRRYFEKDGGGWEQWYKENPIAHGMTCVSLPVFDERSGLVLVYRGGQSNRLAGGGFLIVYKYKDGKLEFIKSHMIWIS